MSPSRRKRGTEWLRAWRAKRRRALNEVRADGGGPILLYDGDCALCTGIVGFVLRNEGRDDLRFAAQRGSVAEGLLAEGLLAGRPELRGIDSALWIEPGKGRVFAKSAAGLKIAAYLGGLWRLALLLWLLPRPLRDWAYDLVARHRHVWAGGRAACPIIPPGKGHRFLDPREADSGP